MSAPIVPARDREDVAALVTDRYLDALLSAAERRAEDAPADANLEPGVRDAARILGHSLVRVHPSFRFEERLASRLLGLATAQARIPAAAGGATPVAITGGRVVAFRGAASAASTALAADPLLDAILCGELDPADAAAVEHAGRLPGARRPLIVGGAITSAAISLAGVAWVAWRASHPAHGTITRAARVRRATAALSAGGLGGPA
jgi:hypothetical protein